MSDIVLTVSGEPEVTVNAQGEVTVDVSALTGGDVDGPASSTDNALARFDGTTGKLIKNSGITVADGASGTLSGTNTGDQNLFGIIAVAGQSNVMADATNDTLTLVAGSNVSITTNATTDTITINATSSGDVAGPSSATDNAIARFDGTTGKLIQNSGVFIYDNNEVSGFLRLTGSSGATDGGTGGSGGGIDIYGGNGAASPDTATGGIGGSFVAIGGNAQGPIPGANAGNVTTYAINQFGGGDINTNAGVAAAGGSINTSEGGGSINTRGNGSIEFGEAATRTTLEGTASTPRAIDLPDVDGTLLIGPAGALDTALARYNGSTGHAIQDSLVTLDASGNLAAINSLAMDTTPTGTLATQGQMMWNSGEETLDIQLNGFALHVGQHVVYHTQNNTGSTINKGVPVMFAGTTGNSGKLRIKPWDGVGPATLFMGILAEQLTTASEGFVIAFGKLRGIQTNGANYGQTWVDGDIIYAGSTSGSLTKVKPTSGEIVEVAAVVHAHASNGILFIRPEFSTALGPLATLTPGTGVATALAINTGTAGAFVVNGGALGTPSGGTLTSCTGLPISTGVSGLGTNVATSLANNMGASGTLAILGANTFTAAQTVNAGTLATAAFSVSQTWNSVGTTCRGLEYAITDTNSATASTAIRVLTGAAASTQVFALDKSGQPTFRNTAGHWMDLRNSGAGLGWAASFSTGGVRSGIGFNCGAGFSALVQTCAGSSDVYFGTGSTFGNPSGTTPNWFALIESFTAGTVTFGASDKDVSGAFTGAGHNCIYRAGRGSNQGTGGAGGNTTLAGADARGSGNNNGGSVSVTGGAATGTGTRGAVNIASNSSDRLGFYGVTAVARATTSGSAAAFTANTSLIANDTATFGGYTIGQIVQALQNVGILT